MTQKTDFRALCAELTEHLALLDEPPHELVCRAQEALTQPDPEVAGPTDEELTLTYAYAVAKAVGNRRGPFSETDAEAAQLAGLRAVLARWGLQPAPPAEGDVAELALKELERTVVLLMPVTGHKKIKRFDTIRAALKRLQELENKADLSPAPVPVAERLPGPEDCDAEGRCWWGKPYGYRGRNTEEPYWVFGDSDCYRFMACTLWLPANAMPLPQGEVE